MKQVDGAECEVVFLVVFSVFFSFSIFFNIKKVQHEKVEHGNNLRWRVLQQYLKDLLIVAAKLSIIDVCGGSGYTSRKSTT